MSYDAQNRLGNIKNSGGATIAGFGYDLQGNLDNKNGVVHRFDFGNRLREVSGKDSYMYDGQGRRLVAYAGQGLWTQYTFSGQQNYVQNDRTGSKEENIYLAGSIIATRVWTAATSYTAKFHHTDALGSPVAVTNQAGAVIERNDYEPYGTVIGKPNYQGIGYTGHVQDAATGLTYMQQRYYDPTVGRFLSVDPVTALSSPVGMFNRYKYAANNPYRFLDPDGRQEKEERERRDTRSIAGHPGAGGMPISGLPELSGSKSADTRSGSGSHQSSAAAPAPTFCAGGADCDFMYNQNEYLDGRISDEEFLDRTQVQGAGGVVGAGIVVSGYGVAKGGPLVIAGGAAGVKYVWKNSRSDGPSAGLAHANGRVLGWSWRGSNFNVRLDYAPIPGSKGAPVLHVNFGNSGRGKAPHIVIWDSRWYSPNLLK